ncbi:MAG: DUF2461 domain-containing protein [Lachnospiraceae bacterium]|nr:DUF2461 domain-containing protein [Lachnospiraceae bacterium]
MESGFCTKSLNFLKENHKNNSREWYAENKKTYEDFLLNPFKHLVSTLAPTMFEIDDLMVIAPAVGKTISRIHNDIRFSNNKSLYRDTMWFTFARPKKERNNYPAYFFEINPNSYRYGMGFFSASVKSMDLYRKAISDREDEFSDLVTCIKKGGVFIPEGEKYKKNIYNGSSDIICEWYNRKNIYVVSHSDNNQELFDFDFLSKKLSAHFNSLAKLYYFLIDAVT